jgi:hypothetical protein
LAGLPDIFFWRVYPTFFSGGPSRPAWANLSEKQGIVFHMCMKPARQCLAQIADVFPDEDSPRIILGARVPESKNILDLSLEISQK